MFQDHVHLKTILDSLYPHLCQFEGCLGGSSLGSIYLDQLGKHQPLWVWQYPRDEGISFGILSNALSSSQRSHVQQAHKRVRTPKISLARVRKDVVCVINSGIRSHFLSFVLTLFPPFPPSLLSLFLFCSPSFCSLFYSVLFCSVPAGGLAAPCIRSW